jgi:PadR family transcriptional regulator PadR
MQDSSWIAQMRKGCAEYSILVTLTCKEAYGYEILQHLSKCEQLTLGESTVYPLLRRLTKEGFLTVHARMSTNGPPRRYYQLTPAGRERLQWMHDYWAELVESMSTIKKEFSHEQ